MIRIAVVEDDKNIREEICNKLNVCVRSNCPVEINDFDSAEAMLAQIDKHIRYHIVFSDIDMPGLNGIEFGRHLKERWANIYLVYLTAHANFASESYCVEAYQYILKNQMDMRLPKIVDDLIQKIERDLNNFIVVGSIADKKKLYYADIIYIRKAKGSKYVEFATQEQLIRERMSIREVIERLNSPEFIEVERACVVNMRYIESIKDDTITLSNKKQVVISRLRVTKVKERINRYWGEY